MTELQRRNRNSTWLAVGFAGLLSLSGAWVALATARAQAPAAPAATSTGQMQPAATNIPEWVAKYAGLQEQAARACQIQLSQEQTKIDELTKQLADAKAAAAAVTPPKK